MLGVQNLTLRTYANGTHGTDGRFTLGTATDTTIRGSIQPATWKDLQRLPEGERSQDIRKLFTQSVASLYVAEAGSLRNSDRIVSGADVFEVSSVQNWPSASPIPHVEAILLRLTETGGTP